MNIEIVYTACVEIWSTGFTVSVNEMFEQLVVAGEEKHMRNVNLG